MSSENIAGGVIIPMVTPFKTDGTIDTGAAEKLTRHVVDGGAAPFVLGTTGESASIPADERLNMVRATLDAAKGSAPVYAGISSNNLTESRSFARAYFDLGVDAVVAHMPAYYQLTDAYLFRYFTDLADTISGPLILYNITAVTHQSLSLEVIDRLSHHPRIIGVKDSERDQQRFDRSLKLWAGRTDFKFLVGWGAVMAESLLQGAAGIVPSTGNIVPELYVDLYRAAVSGDRSAAMQYQERTSEISKIYQGGLTLGESLAALKVILSGLGLCEKNILPPLYRLSPGQEAAIQEQYDKYR